MESCEQRPERDAALPTWPAAFSLDNELALISGGGSGLGLAIGRCMAAAGARVVLIGRREKPLQDAIQEIGPRADFAVHDITKLAEGGSLIDKVTQRYGPVTILVNNAGIHVKKAAVQTSDEDFLSVLTTHVLGAHALCRAVAPAMIERKAGSILFMASMTSLLGMPQVVAYSAAKSAYLGMVRTLATEFSPHGVRVNAIAPGWIETEMLHKALDNDPARKQKILSRTPMARFGAAEDIGMAAVYLCSPAGKFVTGVVLPVDGGASIGF